MVMGTSERKQREKARREEEIVAKAKELFLAQGYEATTVDGIADSLEISKGTIYLHFGGKEELFFRVLREGLEIMYVMFKEATDEEEDGLSKFGAIGIAYARFWNEYPDYRRLFNQSIVRSVNKEPGPQRKRDEEINRQIFELNVAALRQGIEDGSVRGDLDPVMASFIIANSTRGVLEAVEGNEGQLKEIGLGPEEVMDATMGFFGQALGNRPAEGPHGIEEWVKEKSDRSRSKARSVKRVRT
jgi:TetR/AcrR family transcriptional regulator